MGACRALAVGDEADRSGGCVAESEPASCALEGASPPPLEQQVDWLLAAGPVKMKRYRFRCPEEAECASVAQGSGSGGVDSPILERRRRKAAARKVRRLQRAAAKVGAGSVVAGQEGPSDLGREATVARAPGLWELVGGVDGLFCQVWPRCHTRACRRQVRWAWRCFQVAVQSAEWSVVVPAARRALGVLSGWVLGQGRPGGLP